VGGGVLGAFASPATAAIGPPDIPVVTLALATELVGAQFYKQLLAAKARNTRQEAHLRRALANENDHYAAVAKVLSDAGQTPGQASDFDFTFPANAFQTRRAAARLGVQLETVFMGIYLGAVQTLQDASTRALFARIAASQAEHVSFFSAIALHRPIGMSFPVPLSLEEGSAALEPFIS
jgi:demethoxyubiquinone hydroxylase (CLK1/Coq7/Cat5 family)